MNVLQIWIGKLPKSILENMTSVLSMVKENEKYYLVASKNLFLDDSRVEWININIIKKMISDKHQCVKKHWNKLAVENQSDIIRFYLLSKIKNLLYVDSDIVFSDFNVIDSLDSIYLTTFGSRYNFDIIYNGNIDFFEKFFDFLIKSLDCRDNILYDVIFRRFNKFISNTNVALKTIDVNKFKIRK